MEHTDEPYPTAIAGTWTDVERRARYLYGLESATEDEREMAEAVLVLLRFPGCHLAPDPMDAPDERRGSGQ